jgi:hypothetical protein
MSKTRALVAGGIGGVALLAVAALPASAAQSGDTTTTFTLNGGTIDIAVGSSANLPAGSSGQPFVFGQLGPVTVTDNRGNTVSWTASAMTTTFTTNNGFATTTSTSVVYNSGTVNKTGEVTAAGNGNVTLAVAPSAVVTGTSVVGNNTASWDPTLTVNLPSNSLAGSYSGTVTTSVA